MQLNEIYDAAPEGYRSDKDDNTVIKLKDTRKTRLSLDRLHRLRIMNDTRKIEHEKKLDDISTQYKIPAQPPGGL
jgi:hypothetical protein